MSDNSVKEQLNTINKKLEELTSIIAQLCQAFADWTDILVAEAPELEKPQLKKNTEYIS